MNHEETIKRIQELVPSLMALEFGCEVRRKYPSRKIRYAKVLAHIGGGNFQVQERIDSSTNEEEYEKDYGHCEITHYEPDSFEVLGKPITLAVVLLAIGKQLDEDAWEVAINSDGQFIKDWGENKHEMTDYYWNLSKDNFNDQSEETKTFIGNLLNNK